MKSKKATCFCGILTFAAFWLACFLNSFDYMLNQAVNRKPTLAVVVK